MKSKWLGMVMVMLGLTAMASADMVGTYVEANGGEGGNTVNASTGSADDWWTNTNSDTDNLWALRTASANRDGDVNEANAPGENCPTIKTTISGLTPGTSYELRVIYAAWNDVTEDWDIGAGLAADTLTNYHWGDGISEETGVVLEDAGSDKVMEMQVLLGTVVANASGEISAYVDKVTSVGRVRYDGVTYLEVPEPMTMSLLAVGGLGMLIRRKR